MIHLNVTPDIDLAPWTDCGDIPELGTIERIGRLPAGTQAGKSTVTVLIRLADGRRFMAQTTLALLVTAASALKAVDDAAKN